MPEFRRDPTTGDWVIVATERAARPGGSGGAIDRERGGEDQPCPFCAGNEHETPPEILRRPEEGGWLVRVVPNKYPALVPALPEPTPSDDPLSVCTPARGHYEVIVEGPTHRLTLAPDDPTVLCESLLAAQQRYRHFLEDPALRFFSLFKNHGIEAGASLPHPHWQLVASPLVPMFLDRMLEAAALYQERHGRTVYEDIVAQGIATGTRLVEVSSGFAVLTPFAPRWPGETWIIPRTTSESFGDVAAVEIAEFARVLSDTFGRITRAFEDPSVNVLIISAPLRPGSASGFSWHVRILPRMTVPGGFELASGMTITALEPGSVAGMLREV